MKRINQLEMPVIMHQIEDMTFVIIISQRERL